MCYAHALWDDVFLFSHYIYFFIDWVLVYVFVYYRVVENVYARFPQVEPITKCQSSTHPVTAGPNLLALVYQVQHVVS